MTPEQSVQYRNSFLLLITATIWGCGFVAQALGMEHIGPFAFTWARSFIGGVFLLCLMPMFDRFRGTKKADAASPWKSKTLWIGGFVCGTMLFISESLQQFGILYTTVGKASFITALYIVIVPAVSFVFGRHVGGLKVWGAVVLAVAGLYLLCMTDDAFSIGLGDLLVLACAFSFALHILVIDRYAPFVDAIRMSCLQFFIGSIWGMIMMMLFEPPSLEGMINAIWAILFAGVMSNGIAYTLQVVAQKGLNPTLASLIMSLESVVGVLAGWLLLGQTLTMREIAGCAVMAVAIVLAQLPSSLFKRKSKS